MIISSGLSTTNLTQEPGPLIIGERLNAQGSARAKKLMLEKDYRSLIALAEQQVSDGAHCLDICAAVTENADEKEVLIRLARELSLTISSPLSIDTTDADIIEDVLKSIPAKPLINSINLKGDDSNFDHIAPLMAKYGAPAIAMCIGPDGMAKTAEEKLNVAKLIVERGKKHGLTEEYFIFDALVFTLTGQDEFSNSAKETLEGIKLIKREFPKSHTSLGISNISFGLVEKNVRKALNSVFLHWAVKYGLDCAIVNTRGIIPYTDIDEDLRKICDDVIFNRRKDAFEDLINVTVKASGFDNTVTAFDESWNAGERVRHRIENRIFEGIESDVTYAIAERIDNCKVIDNIISLPKEQTHDAALEVLNDYMLPAMKSVGDRFGAGELILPFVLDSAECMKMAVSVIERHLVNVGSSSSKGTIVLGTVYGDVHDIGKNLVKTIFSNNGYMVHDMGKQVPLQKFVDKIRETNADAIGLSALLVNTSREMKHFVDYARENDLRIPILCGGAAINGPYIDRIGSENGIYEHGIFYCNDMFSGLSIIEKIMSNEKQELLDKRIKQLKNYKKPKQKTVTASGKSSIRSITPPKPPFLGVRYITADQINVEDAWNLIDKNTLFTLAWGLRGRSVDKNVIKEQERLFDKWKGIINDGKLFEPAAAYGYFKCNSSDTSITVGDETFEFERSTKIHSLCIADYFGNDDIVAFQAVTAGIEAQKEKDRLDAAGHYKDALYLSGMSNAFAEGMAGMVNNRIRNELGLKQGCLRYSYGYPSCPNMEEQLKLWRLLKPETVGMDITSAGQIIPECSTAAIVVHHKDAKYFSL